MRELFPGFYPPPASLRSEALKSGLVALDANVLLNLHRYPATARNELLSVLEACGERLWIPYQAALEYHWNRLNVIREQRRRFEDVRQELSKFRSSLRSSLDKLQLQKRHALIDPDPLISSVSAAIDKFLEELTALEQHQAEFSIEASLEERLLGILSDRVGSIPTQEWLDQLYKQGSERYQLLMPPGYLDDTKSEGQGTAVICYGGRTFQRRFGDLVLWRLLLEKALAGGHTAVVLVTDDSKEDWWLKSGSQILCPRPELVEEARREAQVECLLLLTSERFVKLGAEALGVEVTLEVVRQIEAVRSEKAREGEADTEDPGFLDKLASAEEGMEELLTVSEGITTELKHMNQVFVANTDRIRAAKDFRLRRKVVNQSASELEAIIPRFAEAIDKLERVIEKISPGIDVVIDKIAELEGKEEDRADTKEALVKLVRALLGSRDSAVDFDAALKDLPDATSTFRHAVNRLRRALEQYVAAFRRVESWLKKLDPGS